ncbi:transcriptional regulator [Bradyrhizobium sp. NBAIM20]|nr:transcriptional regulator [Bradyrhizobium sp. NBAIM20]MCA1461112.1 transcriptional regulator [Bradyrhizobium sp. NBAIM18]
MVVDRTPAPDFNGTDNEPARLALSILEFCAALGISEDFFYKLKRQGKAPRLMKVGSRTMISVQAANEWLIAREADAAAATKKIADTRAASV